MTRNELTKLWAKVTGKFNALIGGAPEALDTLKEIADKLGDDDDALAGLLTQVAGKQDALVSGQNIKSINGQSVLGEGNMTIHEEQLIDKSYAPAEFSGLGRKYLQKNIVSNKNVLTQAMFKDGSGNALTNTIFMMQYDYDLNGQSITIPSGCVLQFEGGSIINGTLVGTNTRIDAGLEKIFGTDVTISGTWNVAEAYPEWFGAKLTNDDTQAIQNCLDLSHTIILEDEYFAIDDLNLTRACSLNSYSKKGILHFKRINCVSSQNISLDGTSFKNICFDGDMSCNGLLIKANNIVIENCTFKNIKSAGSYGYLTSAIFIGDYYSGQDHLIFSNILINNCIFDKGEPYNTTSTADGNPTVSRFILVNNGKNIKITNNIFKDLVGLKDSDCIHITGETESVDYFPFVGEGSWSGSSAGYIGTSYKYSSIFINKNIFYLNNTKSAVKIMSSGVSVVDNKFYVYSDYNSPLGNYSQYSIIRAHYSRNIEYLENQIILQNIKNLDSIFLLGSCYNCNISNNSVSYEENSTLGWEISDLVLFNLGTNDEVICTNNNITLKVKGQCYIGQFESNGNILFDCLNINTNYTSTTEEVKNLHAWSNHYVYPSNTTRGVISFKNCYFNFTGTYPYLYFYCLSEKSFEFINCTINTIDNKRVAFEIASVCDRNDVVNKFNNLVGSAKINISVEYSQVTPGATSYYSSAKCQLEKIYNLLFLYLRLNTEIENCKFSGTYSNHQINIGGISLNLNNIEFQPNIVQVRNESGNSSCIIKNIFSDGGAHNVLVTYIPSGTLSKSFKKSNIYSNGLTQGSSNDRMSLGSDVELGFEYFDSTLNKPCWYKGNGKWIDATGTEV